MYLKNLMLLSSLSAAALITTTTSTNLYQQIQKQSSLQKIFLENDKYEITSKQWKNNEVLEHKMSTSNQKNILTIVDNLDVKIEIIEVLNHNLVFNLLAKSVQKEYQFIFTTDEIINLSKIKQSPSLKSAIEKFVISDFYLSNTNEYFISKENYFAFFDTRNPFQGEMLKDGKLSFHSSWGVWNSARNETKFKYNFEDEILKNHILMTEVQKWGTLKKENIAIKTIKPYKMGFLPIAQLINPPIAEAFWTLKSIDFHNKKIKKMFYNAKQKLILPEGHNNGAEWWRSLIDLITILIAVSSIGTGTILALLGNELYYIIMSVFSSVIGVSSFIKDLMNAVKFDELSVTNLEKFQNQREGFKKINEVIMKNAVDLYESQVMDYRIFDLVDVSPTIEGELEASANATTLIRGKNSQMNLFTTWSAMSADISYLVYK